MDANRVQQNIRHFPPALKRALIRDAADKDLDATNMNDAAVAVLARTYNYTFTPGGARRAPANLNGSDQVTLEMPRELRVKIGIAAEMNGRSRSREILIALCAHYAIRLPAAPARGRRRAAV